MKESINYYYNLNIDEVEQWGSIYRFQINNINYYFVPIKRMDNELNDIVNVSNELKLRNIPVHDIIINKFNKIITNVLNTNYCLLKPNKDIYQEYDLPDILALNNNLRLNPSKSNLYRNNWGTLWSNKIDYFEYQIHELGQNKPIILNSFSYYIGLGENAISYVINANNKYQTSENDRICLSHRRLNYPNYALNYLNPLSFIFDLEVRDIAEFIKSAFFANEDALNYLQYALKKCHFSIYSLSLLYARLLYPTYYFDLYEKVMNDEETEEILIPIIEKSTSYEEFLASAFLEINKYAPIDRVEWLLKKEL